MDVDIKLTSMYEKQGYLEMHGSDILYTILIFIITVIISSFSGYYAIVNELKSNWNQNKCIPIVMPFAGIIMPKPGQTFAETTFENFNYCIQQDISQIFSIIMMPFEFIMYLTIIFLETTVDSIVLVVNTLKWIKSQITGILEEFFNKVINFVIPVVEIVVRIRDIISKITGVVTTCLFTMITIYDITISGVISILTILVNLLIILIGIILAMMALAVALFLLGPFGIAAGIALQIIFMAFLVGVLLPALVICAMLHSAIMDIFKEGSPGAPNPP